jgi:hypothetical protein
MDKEQYLVWVGLMTLVIYWLDSNGGLKILGWTNVGHKKGTFYFLADQLKNSCGLWETLVFTVEAA